MAGGSGPGGLPLGGETALIGIEGVFGVEAHRVFGSHPVGEGMGKTGGGGPDDGSNRVLWKIFLSASRGPPEHSPPGFFPDFT